MMNLKAKLDAVILCASDAETTETMRTLICEVRRRRNNHKRNA